MRNKSAFRITLAVIVIGFLALTLVIENQAAAVAPSQVDFINVGEGDAALLRDGQGFDVLIDGGQPAAGPTVVAYLRQQGVPDIDVMVSTHPDSDHVGGLIDVLQAADIPVKAVLFNGYTGTTTTWNTFATAVANDGLVLMAAQYPLTYTWGAMTVNVLNPEPGLSNPETNNASVVLRVRQGQTSFLFTGDIDATQEAQVVARGTPVAAAVLKVAHHGSAYSSGADFLAAVAPKEAVISVRPNSYGHPAATTLARLAAAGARLWRTDINGTIQVLTGDATYSITGNTWLVYLPVIWQPGTTAGASDLRITALSGLTAPEYVTVKNFGNAAQTMTGWALVSVVGPQTFNFPAGYVLNAGATVQIQSYTGAVNDPPGVLLWTTAAIWNNTGDKAELRDAGNQVISTACYGNACP